MIRLEGYTLGPKLLADSHHEVYTARRDADSLPVLVKVEIRPGSGPPVRLRREHDLLLRIDARGVARPLAWIESPPALVLQGSDGIPLGRYVAEHPPSTPEFLSIAVQLVDAIAAVHAARIVHGDIQPANILISPERLTVQIIDFGRAREIGEVQRDAPHAALREGTLLYLAPEQAGGVDEAIDFRSDLYSLGATLYEILTGAPPFEGEGVDLIQAHVTRLPIPPHERAVDVPEAISRIVCKLLEKAPEARYQSVHGLRADLVACSEELRSRGSIDPSLPLDARDAVGRLAFPRKLYGRERELQQLGDAFARAAKGRTELCLLCGPPGVGKSRAANELRSVVAQVSGHFAAGRFDRFRSDVPCAGFVEAFGSLVDQILTESDARLQSWKDELRAGLGNLASVLVDLVPGLRLLIENPPPLPPVGSKETTQRLGLAICRFIQTVARTDSPLVLFLDDLQWADSASRYLLDEILCTEPTRALLIVGAYQEREVDDTHPLLRLLARLERENVVVQTLQLASLSPEQCAELISDTLGEPLESVQSLAELVRRKTGNLPLHIQQFLLHLHETGLLRADATSRWTWDAEAIAASDIPDDIVAMLESKLARLEEGARDLLKVASCVGAAFDVDTLAEVAGRDRESVGREALRLVEEGLLVPCREGFRFVHDRLREVAQALARDTDQERLHHRVAQLLIARTPEESLGDRIFEIADHLQRASARIADDERMRAIELQLRAGARALSRGGPEAARGYLKAGRSLAREADWESAHPVMFALQLHAAEAAALLGEYAEADAILDALEKRRLGSFERARARGQRVAMYSVTRPPLEAVRVALAGLRELGIRWSERPSSLYVRMMLLRTRLKLRGRTPEQLARTSAHVTPEVVATLTLIMEMAPAAYRLNVNLGALVFARAAELSIEHGAVAGVSSHAIGGFGQAYAVAMGDYDYAAHVARLATRLREICDEGPHTYKAIVSTDLLVNGWCRHRRKALEALRRSARNRSKQATCRSRCMPGPSARWCSCWWASRSPPSSASFASRVTSAGEPGTASGARPHAADTSYARSPAARKSSPPRPECRRARSASR
jgi:predicted ATPase